MVPAVTSPASLRDLPDPRELWSGHSSPAGPSPFASSLPVQLFGAAQRPGRPWCSEEPRCPLCPWRCFRTELSTWKPAPPPRVTQASSSGKPPGLRQPDLKAFVTQMASRGLELMEDRKPRVYPDTHK